MRTLPVVVLLLMLNPLRADAGSGLLHHWSKNFGDASKQQSRAIAISPSGNVYYTGVFTSSINLGGATIPGPDTLEDETYLAKFNPFGTHLASWHLSGDDPDDESVTAMVCDNAGNLIMAAQFSGRFHMGGIYPLSNGGTDI